MRVASVRARAFVHATEDEARVRDGLLWCLGILGQKGAEHRVHRSRLKGHWGNDILLLEAALKERPAAERTLATLVADAPLRDEALRSLERRLDEDKVLHLRLDKQAAVLRRLQLCESPDAIVVLLKGIAGPGEEPRSGWTQLLSGAE